MDILFENRYKRTKEYFKEFYSYFYFKRPIAIILNVICALGFIFGVLLLLLSDPFRSENLIKFYIFFPLFIWFIMILRYFRSVKIRYNQDLEMNNGEPLDVKIMVTNDGIAACFADSESKMQLPYQKIKKILKTKNYYILISEAKLSCTFKKDSFVGGDNDEFLLFLMSKGLKCY